MILFIDDEARRIQSYKEEIEISLNQVIHLETDADTAIHFFEGNTDISLVILDSMMPSKNIFADSETEYGLRTGLCIYKRIRNQNGTIPIVIFTNADTKYFEKEVEGDDQCIILQKLDFLPQEFSGEIDQLIRK